MKRAIISVYDKTGIIEFAKFLLDKNYIVYSTGGTFKELSKLGEQNVLELNTLTNFPEILDGRVKTLHPIIYGGILNKRDNVSHQEQLQKHNIPHIDLVVVNLYPFEETVKKTNDEDTIIENIDIGGVTLIRAAAKNYKDVLVITNPKDYLTIMDQFDNDTVEINNRRHWAGIALKYIAHYDMAISNYFNKDMMYREYEKVQNLKYGTNPQQKFAGLYTNVNQQNFPFKILSGNIGYINVLDAIYSWNLVNELWNVLKMSASASFKHNSPAGVGLGIELSDTLKEIYFVKNKELSPVATSYVRARGADPLSSFGDFVAINRIVDVCTANIISTEVSDGIIALGYEPEALNILKNKKSGNYVILQAELVESSGTNVEVREFHGITLVQDENKSMTDFDTLDKFDILVKNKIDLILANITLKYTQSNSVACALDGQIIGVGAGQQNRVDCVKLTKRKAVNWWLKQSPLCLELLKNFKQGTKKQDKVNYIIDYIENVMPEQEKLNWIKGLSDVSLASDAFFPFRDNIDVCSTFGVSYIIQPGGSVQDEEIKKACDEHNIKMFMTGPNMRMFLH